MRRDLHDVLVREIARRAHDVEGQGDGIFMVLISEDEIILAVQASLRKIRMKLPRPKRNRKRREP